jgi:hypothetical protein
LEPYRDFYLACTIAFRLFIAALALIARHREAVGRRTLICSQNEVASSGAPAPTQRNLRFHTAFGEVD